jgi:hypothetical protein
MQAMDAAAARLAWPDPASVRPEAVMYVAVAAALLFGAKVGLLRCLGLTAALALAVHLVAG